MNIVDLLANIICTIYVEFLQVFSSAAQQQMMEGGGGGGNGMMQAYNMAAAAGQANGGSGMMNQGYNMAAGTGQANGSGMVSHHSWSADMMNGQMGKLHLDPKNYGIFFMTIFYIFCLPPFAYQYWLLLVLGPKKVKFSKINSRSLFN